MSEAIQVQFTGTIHLPKIGYFFSNRTTFWQIIFNLLAVLFVSVDTAINDVIERLIYCVMAGLQLAAISLAQYLVIKRGYV